MAGMWASVVSSRPGFVESGMQIVADPGKPDFGAAAIGDGLLGCAVTP
jgi:hypothetical protein